MRCLIFFFSYSIFKLQCVFYIHNMCIWTRHISSVWQPRAASGCPVGQHSPESASHHSHHLLRAPFPDSPVSKGILPPPACSSLADIVTYLIFLIAPIGTRQCILSAFVYLYSLMPVFLLDCRLLEGRTFVPIVVLYTWWPKEWLLHNRDSSRLFE